MISTLNLALKSLKRSKLRTLLTILGIVIGIAAVIMVMSAGEGLKGLVNDQMSSFGSNFIQIEIKVPSTSHVSAENAGAMAQGIQVTTMTIGDAEAISRLPNIENYYAAIMNQDIASYLDQNKSINMIGVSPGFIEIDSSRISRGRFFSDQEDRELARVAVLGPKLAAKLFGNDDPLGKTIKVGRTKLRIIGVMKERGGGFGIDFDDMMFLPVQTLQKVMMGIDHVQWITAAMKNPSAEDETVDEITQLLRDRHDIIDPKYDDFAVMGSTEAKNMVDSIFSGITLLLIAIAGISLVVGGVGIMNIMYVSVTERTFEIGLRKAVGARRRQILWQFLWEAIIVTLIGGIIGIAAGLLFSYLISVIAGQFGYNWHFSLPPQSIAIAFGFCGAVGLIFGYYPARKAASLDPIVALGHE